MLPARHPRILNRMDAHEPFTTLPATTNLPFCLQSRELPPEMAPLVDMRSSTDGVLLIHGFSGGPWDMRPLAAALAADGLTVVAPLLAGHGDGNLAPTTWHDWLADARKALDWLAPQVARVHLVGLSMGGLLTLLLGRQPCDAPIGTLTLLAPAMSLPRKIAVALRTLDLTRWPRVVGRPHSQGPNAARMPVASVLSVLELQEVVRSVAPTCRVPALVLHGTEDKTISCERARQLVEPLLGDEGRWQAIEGAGHVLPQTDQAAEVVELVSTFIRQG
ncbi:MAG: alpha/beta fold hydrolase [Myxococcales bacterium]|nr:alpha/beta fold hydrolase [Myxococcales bacterium]